MQKQLWLVASVLALTGVPSGVAGQETRIPLDPKMVVNERDRGNPEAMVDEQARIGAPPSGKPESTWKVNSKYWKTFPYSAYLDLGQERNLSSLWLFDTFNNGELVLYAGTPQKWQQVARHETLKYMQWTKVQLDITTRYLRIERVKPSCIFSERINVWLGTAGGISSPAISSWIARAAL